MDQGKPTEKNTNGNLKQIGTRYSSSRLFNSSDVGEKLLARHNQTADELAARNTQLDQIHENRFAQHKRLVHVSIAVSVFTLIILLLFSFAFFKYTIIVTN
jgi:hypothetical protein